MAKKAQGTRHKAEAEAAAKSQKKAAANTFKPLALRDANVARHTVAEAGQQERGAETVAEVSKNKRRTVCRMHH